MAKSGPPRKLSNRDLRTAIEMRRSGSTLEAIASRLGCSAKHVSTILIRAESEGERLPVARVGRPRKRPAEGEEGPRRTSVARPAASPPDVPSGLPGAGAPLPAPLPPPRGERDESPLPMSPDEALEELRLRRLPELARVARDALADGNLPLFRDAVKIELDLAQRIRDATPPPPPDPEDDPAYTDARDRVRAKLEDLAAHVRSRGRAA